MSKANNLQVFIYHAEEQEEVSLYQCDAGSFYQQPAIYFTFLRLHLFGLLVLI